MSCAAMIPCSHAMRAHRGHFSVFKFPPCKWCFTLLRKDGRASMSCRQDVDEEDAYDADVDEKDGERWQQ